VRADHFIIAGGQRCGTTLLYRLLAEHPEIEMARPMRPEPKFFLRDDAEALGLESYAKYFSARRPGVRLLGEKSTSYIERPQAAVRIRRLLPGARVVFILRDPVDRAISNYWFSRNHGVETLDMVEAFRLEEAGSRDYDRDRFSVSPFSYVHRGCYVDFLAHWDDCFPRDRMKVVLLERLLSDGDELGRLFAFLGARREPRIEVPTEPVNASRRPSGGAAEMALRARLASRFCEPNRRLAERYDLDLSCWPSMSRFEGPGAANLRNSSGGRR